MKNLVLIGGGGHCKAVLDSVIRMGTFDKIVITDPSIPAGTIVMGCEVIGTDDCLMDLYENGFKYAFVTVGSVGLNPIRERLVSRAAALGFQFPNIIDPSAIVAESAIIGDGVFLGKNIIVNAYTEVGDHCIINTGTIIEHECRIGIFAHISIGSILCGNVNVGKNSFIGAGSIVIQCHCIGDNVVIGAGAVVNKDIPSNCTAVGFPARVIRENGK